MELTTELLMKERCEVIRLVEDAFDYAIYQGILNEKTFEKLLERSNELQYDILSSIHRIFSYNQFVKEESPFRQGYYPYPEGYHVKDISLQIKLLNDILPGLGNADEDLAQRPLPRGADGYFAIPRWHNIASNYLKAIEKVFAIIESTRSFDNDLEERGKMHKEYLIESTKKADAMARLTDQQRGCGILVVPCQFGIRHRDRSPQRALEVMNLTEFALGAYEAGIMLLTHPEREITLKQLHIECAGDRYSRCPGGPFDWFPAFRIDKECLRFDAGSENVCLSGFGVASGFVP